MDAAAPTPHAILTDREREVLTLRAAGHAVSHIATQLIVEPRTVKFHLRNVYAKLGLRQHTHGARQLALAQYAADLAPQARTLEPSLTRRHLFQPDRTLTQVLARGRFTLSAEVIPPRNGAEQAAVLSTIANLV